MKLKTLCLGGIIETLDLLDDLDYIVRPLSIDGNDLQKFFIGAIHGVAAVFYRRGT
jgi:hypothetical protein